MKKYALTLGLSILALAACGKQAEQADSKPDSQQAEETTMAAEDSQTTDAGVIKLRLFPKKAPIAVQNWITLSKQGFYNGTPFARVIKDYVIQGGALDGSGDESKSSYNGFFQDEVNMELHNFNGALCLGNNGPHTNGNQFYIVQCSKVRNETSLPIISFPENVKAKYREVGGIPELDGRYTVLGQVYEGMDVVEKIASQETNENDAPVSNPINIQSIRFQKY